MLKNNIKNYIEIITEKGYTIIDVSINLSIIDSTTAFLRCQVCFLFFYRLAPKFAP